MKSIQLSDLTRAHVDDETAIWVLDHRSAIVVVKNSVQLRCGRGPNELARLKAKNLLVEVPLGTKDPPTMVRAALEYLGLGTSLH